MSEFKYKKGDVALVECSDGEWRRAMHGVAHGRPAWRFPDGIIRWVSGSVARPLVVIDPESGADVERVIDAFEDDEGERMYPAFVIAALRECLAPTPPRLAEPMGLGDLVTDRFGDTWARRYDGRFTCISGPNRSHRTFIHLTDDFGPLTSGKATS